MLQAYFDDRVPGNKRLSWVFWVEGVLASHVLFLALLAAYQYGTSALLVSAVLGFIAYTAWIMLLGGVPIFVGTALFEDVRVLREVSLAPALGVAYNVLVAFAFAHWAWIKLATSVPVTVFSVSMLVIPVIGVLSGVAFLGERPRWTEVASLFCVLGAHATVIRRQ